MAQLFVFAALRISRHGTGSLVSYYETMLAQTHETIVQNKDLRRIVMKDMRDALAELQLNVELDSRMVDSARQRQFLSVKKIISLLSSFDHLSTA
jgi:hypothetical protein